MTEKRHCLPKPRRISTLLDLYEWIEGLQLDYDRYGLDIEDIPVRVSADDGIYCDGIDVSFDRRRVEKDIVLTIGGTTS